MSVTLVRVEDIPDSAEELYTILLEREGDDDVNISHRETPSFSDHVAFVENHPYAEWCLIFDDANNVAGSIYITKPPTKSSPGNEIGIFIKKAWRECGFAAEAIELFLSNRGDGPFYANINPNNIPSISLFEKTGFRLCQLTLKREK